MSTMRQRDRILSPPRFRRQTVGIVYSPPNSQSVPNSARHSTPRPRSALDRKWVHRSQGDLTLDMDLQAHPRLQSEFYQELYQKYPHAFRRRLESREAGRKLFNSCLHVRFKDDADISDDNYDSHRSLGNFHSNTHLTNWDREVGHFMKHKSRSKECVTSVDASECSGSGLSVSQRLKLNSQSLNKLLKEDLPFRKHTPQENVQYDSGTENEQSLQDYLLQKSKERSRHRKQQRRIIIQRKIHKNDSVEINKENERNSRRWLSKSVSPSRRLFGYSLSHTNLTNETNAINVESLIADSDLKIETLLEKVSAKMSGPESPPDSAIDVDTPSVQSLIAPDIKSGNSVKHDPELPALNGEETGSFDSPGSSASACNVMGNSAKIYDIMQEEVSINSVQCSNDIKNIENMTSEPNVLNNYVKEDILEEDEMNKIVEKYGSIENFNQNTGSGLLQLYTADMENENLESEVSAKGSLANVENTHKDEVFSERNSECTKIETNSVDLGMELDKAKCTVEKNESEIDVDGDDDDVLTENVNMQDSCEIGNAQCVEQVDYNADDEQEVDVVMTDAINSNNARFKRHNAHRESDVDSGIGYSSTGTDTLPPRGRAQKRETNMKHQPVKADHSLLPLRSEVDVDILDEVNLVHLSHDLLKSHDQRGRIGNSVTEERDDTDIRLGISKVSERDKKIAEKYRRARSPSPYILRNLQSPAGCRPKSAPSFAQSELDLRVVDIPLSENSILASAGAGDSNVTVKCSHPQPESTRNSNTTSKTSSCRNSDIISKYSSLPNLTGNQSRHSKPHSSNNMSSRLVKQRQCSVSSISSKDSSISLLSENEADAVTRACNLSYDDGMEDIVHLPEGATEDDYAKDIEEEKFTEIEQDSGTNIENLAEQRPSELKKLIEGMYQPAVTSPRVKEKRLKIRNILKQRKGIFSPSEDSKKPQDEKNALNRIYAKSRESARGYENVTKKSDDNMRRDTNTKSSVEVSNTDIGPDKANCKPLSDLTNSGNSVTRTSRIPDNSPPGQFPFHIISQPGHFPSRYFNRADFSPPVNYTGWTIPLSLF